MSSSSDKRNVFISYSRQDTEAAHELVSELEKAGVSVWLDIAEIRPGDRWQSMIQEELRKARVMVVLLTPSSLASQWTYFEVGAAVADGKIIIPVLSKDVLPEQVPSLLRNFQWISDSPVDKAAKLIADAVSSASE
jgi:hypothetical protein